MSIRESLEEAVNTVEETNDASGSPLGEQAPGKVTAVVPQVGTVTHEAVPSETDQQKADRTAGRKRDEHGRLLPGKAERPTVQAQQVQQQPLAPRMPPPSSWKKDHWQAWDKLSTENPQLAEYLNQREGEFAKGVSTYKQEYENVRPMAEAIQQFMPVLQQHGITPAQWITNMGNAHHTLVYGSPQQKLQAFSTLAQQYQVPLQALYDPNAQQQFLMQQQLQPPAPQPDVNALLEQKFMEREAKTDLQRFQEAKDASGNPLYPHYDTVRMEMAQLLDANFAQDLESAYEIALFKHKDIWSQEQAAKQAAASNAAQQVQQRQVSKAKAAAVSPRTATPGAQASAQAPKGIRSAIESAFDAHAEGGRV